MKKDNDYKKKELLLEAAKKEFLEKGYNKASLRKICSQAGVTTGALYFFFNNKEDLFAAIVDEPIRQLKDMLVEHFNEDRAYMASLKSLDDIEMDHSDISDMLVEHIYSNYDCFLLLLTASQDTVYENVIDEFVELTERSIPYMLTDSKDLTYDEYMAHWLAHISIDAFSHVIKHERDKEVAKKRLRSIMNYLVRGWVELVMVSIKTEQ